METPALSLMKNWDQRRVELVGYIGFFGEIDEGVKNGTVLELC